MTTQGCMTRLTVAGFVVFGGGCSVKGGVAVVQTVDFYFSKKASCHLLLYPTRLHGSRT